MQRSLHFVHVLALTDKRMEKSALLMGVKLYVNIGTIWEGIEMLNEAVKIKEDQSCFGGAV